MQASYSLLYIKLGLLFQPQQESYQTYGHLVTHLWMKMLWEKSSMFALHTVVADLTLQFLRVGNQFIMQVLIKAGYMGQAPRRLNRVRVSLQLLFVSNVLTVSGNKISKGILSHQPQGEAWSTMRRPTKQPTDSDMSFWRNAMLLICPSRSSMLGIGRFIGKTHRVWRWFWGEVHSTILYMNLDGVTEDVFMLGRKPNRFLYSHSQPR